MSKKFIKIFVVFAALVLGGIPSSSLIAQTVDSLVLRVDELTEKLLYRNNDTNYIKNYNEQIAAKIVAVNKINYFNARDKENQNILKYRPVQDISLGIGLAYKFFAFDLTIGLGIGDNSGLENTRSLDFQGRMFSSKQLVSTTLQYYQGYRLARVNGIELDPADQDTRREDLRTMNLMLDYTYAFNYTKFSMKAPFVFNERQKKSAGSVVAGVSFSIFNMSADSSIVPLIIKDQFHSSVNLTSVNVINIGIKAGYMYTYVYKSHFFITLSLIPGLILNYGDYSLEKRRNLPTALNFSISSLNSIGYNGEKFFAGFSYIFNNYFVTIDSYAQVLVGSGKMSAFVGYRFGKL